MKNKSYGAISITELMNFQNILEILFWVIMELDLVAKEKKGRELKNKNWKCLQITSFMFRLLAQGWTQC